MRINNREFYVFIEQDEDGLFIGEVPQLNACYSQGETIDDLITNIKEVIEMCLEEEEDIQTSKFVGIQKVVI